MHFTQEVLTAWCFVSAIGQVLVGTAEPSDTIALEQLSKPCIRQLIITDDHPLLQTDRQLHKENFIVVCIIYYLMLYILYMYLSYIYYILFIVMYITHYISTSFINISLLQIIDYISMSLMLYACTRRPAQRQIWIQNRRTGWMEVYVHAGQTSSMST